MVANGTVPVVDEWIYIQAAREFAANLRVEISLLSLAVAIFDTLYGGLAVAIVGPSFSTFTVASSVLAGMAGVAFYGMLRNLDVGPNVAGIAVGALMMGFLPFAMNTTFMTDGHAVSLTILSASIIARSGMRSGAPTAWLLLAGALAGFAYLSRPGAIAVILGAVWVLTQRREWKRVFAASIVPAAVLAFHLLSAPALAGARAQVVERMSLPTLNELGHAAQLTLIHAGLVVVPLAPLVVRHLWRRRTMIVWSWFLAVTSVSLSLFLIPIRIGDWLTSAGIFPLDSATVGTRPALLEPGLAPLMLFVIGLVGLVALLHIFASPSHHRPVAVEVALWSAAIASLILNLSSLVPTGGVLLDRYLLPVLPATIFSVATRLPGNAANVATAVSVALLGVVAILSTALTLDGYRAQSAVFRLAQDRIEAGLAYDELDGGAAWTGLHLGKSVTDDDVVLPLGPVWWRKTFANDLEPRFTVVIGNTPSQCTLDSMLVDPIIGQDFLISVVDESCRVAMSN